MRDIKNPQADVDVALRHWGFSAEQSRRIKAAATPEAFDAAVREEMPRRAPENIASGRREAETAWRQAEQQQADPALPKLEAITRGERGTEWIVRDGEGRETLRTPNSETAQLALAELQQSAARRRGAGDAAEANTPESPENLNQLRMSKGRQEPHRLAQPINTRYLSHDEQLRDPAHVLQSTLREDGGADEGQQRKHGRRLASPARLYAWASQHWGESAPDPQKFTKAESGGGEHAILRDEETGRLVKLTKPGLFGAQAEDAGAYLERLALSNRVFGDDVRFEGIVTLPGEHAPRVVTSQSFVEGRDATAAEQAEYLRSKGFIEHDGRWVHPVLGVAVWDTQTPGNVITRPDGTMQAVDLQVEKARPEELRAVRQQSGLGLPTVFSKSGVDHVDNGDRYAIAPAGYGIRRLTARDVPQPVKADSDPFTHVPEGSGLSAWGRAWSSWLKTHKQSWKRPEPIPTSDGPILISTKTEKEMERVAVKEDAHLHYIAATKLPDLIEHSVLKSVERESKGKPDVAEVHRRYAWMDFPDGKRRSVLLTIFRWDAKIDRDFDTAYSEQVVLEVKSEPLGGSSKRGDKHIELAPSGRETLAQFLSGIKPEHLSDREGPGVSREQARQWVDEVLRKWGSQLDVTVHESAEAIPDAALRDRVLGEGDVEGFYFGADRRVHVLADQIRSRDRVEPLLKHEGFHWVVDGPLKAEYESLRQWAREQIPADKLEQLRKSYPEEVVVEEYLAHLAETNPKSTTWQRFVYEFRRLLRRVLGDRVEFTEEDLRAFLAKAQKRVERAGSQERGDLHTGEALREGGDDLKLSRSARALLDGEESIPPSLALQAMREVPDHAVTRALTSWLVGGFRDIQSGKAPETEAILRKFLLRLPPYESKTPLYRGVPFHNEPELRAFLNQFQGNEWLNTRPFMSTTKDKRVGYKLVKNSSYPVFIEIQGASSARDVELFGELAPQYQWQREVLYTRGATFRVVTKPTLIQFEGKSIYIIRLEETK